MGRNTYMTEPHWMDSSAEEWSQDHMRSHTFTLPAHMFPTCTHMCSHTSTCSTHAGPHVPTCDPHVLTCVVKAIEHKTPEILQVQENNNQTVHLISNPEISKIDSEKRS